MKFLDRASVGSTKETKEGYLVATSRVARTGVQLYLASELGDQAINDGFKPEDIVRLNRSPEEVFHKDSLASITRTPITIGHPEDDVTADNWSKLSVGEIGDSYSIDGDWIVVNPMIKDSRGVQAAKTTHRELSMGYSANLVRARDAAVADYDVVDIRYNHTALVAAARAGDQARIGDSWGATSLTDFQPGNSPKHQGGRMADMKTVVLGDKAVQVADTDVLAIEQYKADMTKKLGDAEAGKQAAVAAVQAEMGALKVELQKAKDAANIDVDALVAARTELLSQVKAIDSAIVTAGKSDAELRKAAVAAKMGDAALAGASDAEIKGMFTVLAKDAATTTNPVQRVLQSGVQRVGDAALMQDAALAKANSDMNAWRNQH
ncbi:DUF2213 domain-containing protein [Pseudomonas sp.]|uniref:DUF2213 domain-containing protein n=1 Tax=Pseudomonas sp. TaxID=306 RepID=UPI00258D643B|nr:DUF2213 domain-containing protein [Pseudomonas sp.]